MAVMCMPIRVWSIPARSSSPSNDDGQSTKDPVETVAEEVQAYSTDVYTTFDKDNFEFPGKISFYVDLKRHEELDCPCLKSYSSATSEHGNVCDGEVEILAASGNVQDIFSVLRLLNFVSFELSVVQRDYHSAASNFLSNNPSLRHLSIRQSFWEEDGDLILSILKGSTSLSTLDLELDSDETNDENIQKLNACIRTIPECKGLEILTLSKVDNLSQETIKVIADALANSKLKSLDISCGWSIENSIDVEAIAHALKKSDTLQELVLTNRRLSNDSCVSALANAIRTNKSLTKLDLGPGYNGNDLISPDAWILMGNALSTASALQHLDLSYYHLSEASWKALAEGLKFNKSLLKFVAENPSSENNSLSPDALTPLGNALAKGSALQHLELSGYRLSKSSWHAFGDGLKSNENLTALILSAPFESKTDGNEVDYLLPMFEMLRENSALQSLKLTRFDLSESLASMEALASALTVNNTLKSLALSNSSLTDEGVERFSHGLPMMTGIEHLDLSYNTFSSHGAQTLAEGLKTNYNLLSVEVGQENFDGMSPGYEVPISAKGFEREYHEIQYYARLNRRGRRCLNRASLQPSLLPLVLERAMRKEKPFGGLTSSDVRREDKFAGDYDTSIDAVFIILSTTFEP